jgi:hypothetical protein
LSHNRGQSCVLHEKVTIPTSDEQIQFLVSLQRLLDEGQFVASYKFALLLSLADLCVEMGNDSGSALTLTTDAIGYKFIQYYWRQAVPYPAASKASVLQQNTSKQAAVINLIGAARGKHGDSIASIMKQTQVWKKLLTRCHVLSALCLCGNFRRWEERAWTSCTKTLVPG